jgi:hypothetical protein
MSKPETCGNCGQPEAADPPFPVGDECDCLALTDHHLRDQAMRCAFLGISEDLEALALAACYKYAMGDMAKVRQARKAIDQAARIVRPILARIYEARGEPMPLPFERRPCPICYGTGASSLYQLCSCAVGENNRLHAVGKLRGEGL